MANPSWNDRDPRLRRLIVIGGAVDGVLKTAALIDLRRRPDSALRGSRKWWKAALLLTSSGGVVPVAYFVRGRA